MEMEKIDIDTSIRNHACMYLKRWRAADACPNSCLFLYNKLI